MTNEEFLVLLRKFLVTQKPDTELLFFILLVIQQYLEKLL